MQIDHLRAHIYADGADLAGLLDLYRNPLIKGLTKVTSWDAGGLHPVQNPGQNRPNTCVLYLQVKGGKFVRAFPDKGFSCDPSNTTHIEGTWGTVPVEK